MSNGSDATKAARPTASAVAFGVIHELKRYFINEVGATKFGDRLTAAIEADRAAGEAENAALEQKAAYDAALAAAVVEQRPIPSPRGYPSACQDCSALRTELERKTEALRQWKCRACDGTKVKAVRVPGKYDYEKLPCKTCGATGLHPSALRALELPQAAPGSPGTKGQL